VIAARAGVVLVTIAEAATAARAGVEVASSAASLDAQPSEVGASTTALLSR
jgi:hypothetical protein